MIARARLLILLCSALLLGGCGVRFAYSQLDWLVPWYLRDYVSFDAGQRSLLDQRLAARLDWHCRAHLPDYVGLLRDARKEFLGGSAEARRAAQVERMEKRLRNWFGRLDTGQRALVAAWSDALQPTTEQWLENRRQWQQGVIDTLRVRHDPQQFSARIAALRAPLDASAPAAHHAQVAHNRQLTLQLLADVFNAASPAQRERLLAEIDGLAAQFDRTACAGPRVATAG